jgi:polyisoprenoid-binding protein YceI
MCLQVCGTEFHAFNKETLMKPISVLILAAALTACTSAPQQTTPAAYRVDAQQSALHFVTTKAGQAGAGGVSEVGQFSRFVGGLGADGRITLEIDLASVDTGIGIRDDRMRTILFNVAAMPKAVFAAQVDPAMVAGISVNSSRDIDLNGTLTLAGQSKPVAAKLRVSRLERGSLQVATRVPIIVDVNQYGMKSGVEALREVVGLNFLASAAPVTFTLALHAQR